LKKRIPTKGSGRKIGGASLVIAPEEVVDAMLVSDLIKVSFNSRIVRFTSSFSVAARDAALGFHGGDHRRPAVGRSTHQPANRV
jgi:hypothetical protein